MPHLHFRNSVEGSAKEVFLPTSMFLGKNTSFVLPKTKSYRGEGRLTILCFRVMVLWIVNILAKVFQPAGHFDLAGE